MDYQLAHFNMIEQQIRPWDVLDTRILDVLSNTARHHFVPANYQALAYSETPIPLNQHYQMLEPKIAGRFLQAVNPQPHEQALEIGTGSGYVTALLAQLSNKVTTVDIDAMQTQHAQNNLTAQSIHNVSCMTADGLQAPQQSYHVIVLTAAVNDKPASLLDALELGGRLVAVVGKGTAMQAICYTRTEMDQWVEEVLFETQLPYLSGINQPKSFSL